MFQLKVISPANIVEVEETFDDMEELTQAVSSYLEDFGPYGSTIEISQVI